MRPRKEQTEHRVMIRSHKLRTMTLVALATLALLPLPQTRNFASQVSEVAHYYVQLEEVQPDLGRWQRLLLSLAMSAGGEQQAGRSGGSVPQKVNAG